ncbi:MAG TPA: hypothetical protein VKB86_11000 [Pyrinomonadaceae bacterium]|nr:hypothetical protein [Pyrinomonadaceae bacterium]
MLIIEGHDYDFPVIGYDRKGLSSERVFTPKNVYGTAFNIGENYFMTAGHSLKSAAGDNDTVAIGFIDGQHYCASEAMDYEVIPEYDVGFIKVMAKIDRAKGFQWEHKRIHPYLTLARVAIHMLLTLKPKLSEADLLKGILSQGESSTVFPLNLGYTNCPSNALGGFLGLL